MEELMKAYQRFTEAAENEPTELMKAISYLEFVKENLCSQQAVEEYKHYLDKAHDEKNVSTLYFAAQQAFELLTFLNNYTTVTRKVCEKACDSLAHTTDVRRILYQELYNDIKIWKF